MGGGSAKLASWQDGWPALNYWYPSGPEAWARCTSLGEAWWVT